MEHYQICLSLGDYLHVCCIINKEYVETPENIKIAKKLNNRRHFFKCIIIYSVYEQNKV